MTASDSGGDPFAAPGRWYRGNLHTHSTNSDGARSPADAVGWYRDAGYDFVALSDHRVVSDTTAMATADFLTLPAMEMHAYDETLKGNYHILGVGMHSFDRSSEEWTQQDTIDRVNADGGLAILAHPYWLGQREVDIRQLQGYVGLEVFNSICQVNYAKGCSATVWDDICTARDLTWGFASDDTHWRHDEQGKGWIMVRTDDFSVPGLIAAMRRGHFYASTGPEIEHVGISDGRVSVRCSPARRVSVMAARQFGRSYSGTSDDPLTVLEHPLNGNEQYVRIEVEDEAGRIAWSNPRRV